jgi:cytochrome c oxidase subunit IV
MILGSITVHGHYSKFTIQLYLNIKFVIFIMLNYLKISCYCRFYLILILKILKYVTQSVFTSLYISQN